MSADEVLSHHPTYMTANRGRDGWVQCSCGWLWSGGNLMAAQLAYGTHLVSPGVLSKKGSRTAGNGNGGAGDVSERADDSNDAKGSTQAGESRG